MTNKKSFSFDDDTLEIDVNEVEDTLDSTKEVNESTAVVEEEIETVIETEPVINEEVEPMKENTQKKKFKYKPRLWHFVLLAFVIGVGGFMTWVYIVSSHDGPIYGDRCASAIAIDQASIDSTVATIKENEAVQDVIIEVECNTIKFTMTFVDDTSSKDGQTIAKDALLTLDDTIGNEKVEDSKYSNLFTYTEENNQYDVSFVLRSNGDSDYPIFGQKHPTSESIAFTGSNPADQDTTDAINASIEEENAAEQETTEE